MTAMKVVPGLRKGECCGFWDSMADAPECAQCPSRQYYLGHKIAEQSAPLSAVEPAPDGLVEQTLALVVGVRERIKRSPGLSSEPFSDKGWAVIEAAMRSALTSRAAVLEEAAKICEATYPEKLGNELIELPCFDNAAECAAAIRAAKGGMMELPPVNFDGSLMKRPWLNAAGSPIACPRCASRRIQRVGLRRWCCMACDKRWSVK